MDPINLAFTIIAGISLTFVLGMYGWLLGGAVANSHWFRRFKFRVVFGIWPGKADDPERRIKQEIIDNRLGELATDFANACRVEESILSPYQKGEHDSGWNPWTDLKVYQKAHKRTLRKKQAFWSPWGLAKAFDYLVKASVKAYGIFPSSVDEEGRIQVS